MYLLILLGPIFSLIVLCFVYRFIPRFFSFLIILGSLFLSLLLSLVTVYEVVYSDSFCLIELNTWFKVGLLEVKWSFLFDKLSTFLLFIIVFISLLVHYVVLILRIMGNSLYSK